MTVGLWFMGVTSVTREYVSTPIWPMAHANGYGLERPMAYAYGCGLERPMAYGLAGS
jgi:hypothetical protein